MERLEVAHQQRDGHDESEREWAGRDSNDDGDDDTSDSMAT